MSIVITGNPGVGKHTVTKKISEKLGFPIIDINIVAKDLGLFEKNDNTNDVDTQKLAKILEERKLNEKNSCRSFSTICFRKKSSKNNQ